jgi:RNA polymerase sigma-70 factor, ECF subfamily
VDTTLTAALPSSAVEKAEGISPQAFDEIVRQHQKRVYRVLWVLLKDADAADTLTQECFLRAYRNMAGFRGECRVETWLLRIAVNLARDHNKSRRISFWKRLVGLDNDNGYADQMASPQASPERALLAREELDAVRAAMKSLSQQQRTVFLLRFAEEMSLSEIAAVLDVKVGSVKAQLSRALGKLRKVMKEQQWR